MPENKEIEFDKTLEKRNELSRLEINLRILGEQYFNVEFDERVNYSKLIQELSKIYKLSLQRDLEEFIIKIDESPILFLTDSPLNLYLRDYYKNHFQHLNGEEHYDNLKHYLSKWFIINSEKDKEYFSTSILNVISVNKTKRNFIAAIFNAIILMFDKKLFNPDKAIELLNEALSDFNDLKFNAGFKEDMVYQLNLLIGFSNILKAKYDAAKDYFSKALFIKTNGINARFYLAVCEAFSNNPEAVEHLLKEIFESDLKRLIIAIENNSISLLDYFSKFSYSREIFYRNEFSRVYEFYAEFLIEKNESKAASLLKLERKINGFIIDSDEKEYEKNAMEKIIFLQRVIKKIINSQNILLINLNEIIFQNFKESIEIIIFNIKELHNKKIEELLIPLTDEINEYKDELENTKQEQENVKEERKNKLAKSIKEIEDKFISEISHLEKRILELKYESRYNPRNSFNHTMIYNFILSFVVFFLGGCAGYSNIYVKSVSELKNLLSVSILTGLKWGVLSFLVGILIAIFIAGLVLIERSNLKQKLINRIARLKSLKDKNVNSYNKEFNEITKKITIEYSNIIDDLNMKLESLNIKKKLKGEELQKEIDEKLKEEINALEGLLK